MQCARCTKPTEPRLVHINRVIVWGLAGLGFTLAWFIGGSLLHDLAEGQRRDIMPFWHASIPLGVLLGSVVAGFVRWQQPICPACETGAPAWLITPLGQEKSAKALDPEQRRTVLRVLGGVGTGVAASIGGIGVAVTRNRGWLPVANDFFITQVENASPTPRDAWKDSKIVNYRRLGRTNEFVSDISLGGGRINDINVARYAIEKGINYFDTAPDYSDTNSERVLGEALKGHRDKIFLATKFCVGDGHLLNDTPVPQIIEAVEASLKRLQTDRVDLIHVHSCDRVDRLMAPNIHEAFDLMKQQGKVRFLGFSSHTPNLEEVANKAIDSGRFDVMMLAYHFGMWPNFGHILEKAKQHDVGVVAMKTLKGAKHTNLANFRDEANVYSQSAFRWVLSNPAVACLVISIYEQRHVDEYLVASGTKPSATDIALLEKYDDLTTGDYCAPHCGKCLDSCEHDLAINDILRYRMYHKDYHWESEGKRLYAKLEKNASLCTDCSAPCAGKCPIGVPIQEKMSDAHRWLS